MAVLVTGGARSGKSTFAEKLAMHNRKQGIYIATAQIYDEEMRERMVHHQEQRKRDGFTWMTVEEPYELSEHLRRLAIDDSDISHDGLLDTSPVVLVDCMTLWISNWLLRFEDEADRASKVSERIDDLLSIVSSYSGQLVLVTNEVGSGLVPEYPLGRSFRDLAGKMNQRLAEACEQVFLVTAGIPIELKSRAYRLD